MSATDGRGWVLLAALTTLAARASAEPAEVSWAPGDRYFRLAGRSSFLLGRNPTGWRPEHFDELLGWAADAGERLVRLHLTVGLTPHAVPGAVDEAWATRWEAVFTQAAARGLVVLPVFENWADWNDGRGGQAWHRWEVNPYNRANGGPASAPAELLADTPCRRLWLRSLDALVRRWSGRREIVGWEIFSELDLVSGASEPAAGEFVGAAASVVRAADAGHRPVTASLSGGVDWPRVFEGPALDLVQAHVYADAPPYRGDLARQVIDVVHARLARYHKPALLGESGLSSAQPAPGSLPTQPRALIGLRQAIWAEAVSGAMNGRMLWWEDGYDRYGGLDLRTAAKDLAAPVARFVGDVDYTGLRPMELAGGDDVWGAALGNDHLVLAWVRDAQCLPPQWPEREVRANVRLTPPGDAAEWRVEAVSTESGQVLTAWNAPRTGRELTVTLPPFRGSLALRLLTSPP
jgi:hypothetical protein